MNTEPKGIPDYRRLTDEQFRDAVAWGLARGLLSFKPRLDDLGQELPKQSKVQSRSSALVDGMPKDLSKDLREARKRRVGSLE